MPPFIDFDQLQSVAVDQLEENEVEQYYRDLLEVQIENVNAENVRALFNLCRNIMELKNAQTQVAFEELEQIASDKVKIGADREQELLGETEELKQQLSTLRRQTAEANLTKDAEPLKEEIKFLTEENERLQRDFIDLRNDLLHEKDISSEQSARLEEYERETRDMKKERNQLIEDVRECQRQLYSQRENVSSRRTETEDYQKKLRSRNQEMINLVDEISNLNDTNDVLQQQVKELRDSLEESVKQMEKTTDQYARLKMEAENADLRKKLSEAGILTSNKPSLEDELIAEFNKKIEEWKALFQEKENELTQTKKKVEILQQEIVHYQMDSDRVSIATLNKALGQRDEQIKKLKSDLELGVTEMERNADLLEQLQARLNAGGTLNEVEKRRLVDLQKQLRAKDTIISEALKRTQEAEKNAMEKDRLLIELTSRMRRYETGQYGLAEAVDEIRDLKKAIAANEKIKEKLIQQCSKIELHCMELLDENDDLRQKLGLKLRKPIEAEFMQIRKIHRETDRALNIILQKEIERLEEERLTLKLQTRKLAQRLGERAVALELSAEELTLVDQFTEEIKTKKLSGSDGLRLIGRQSGQKEENSATETYLTEQTSKDCEEVKRKVAELESENEKLIQGLKEINERLLKRGASDGESHDISIPILEKLLKILESRDVSSALLRFRSQLDSMSNRNGELETKLKSAQMELQQSRAECKQQEAKVKSLEDHISRLKEEQLTGALYHVINLPEGIQPTSSLIIMNLNEHLVQTLQELDLKTKQLEQLDESVHQCRRKISLIKHQKGLVYKEYVEAKAEWSTERDVLNKKAANAKFELEKLRMQVGEFENGQISSHLALKVMTMFDKVINKALSSKIRTRVQFKAEQLTTYRFCDNVWTFVMENVEFRDTSELLNSSKVKIVACDGRAAIGPQTIGTPAP